MRSTGGEEYPLNNKAKQHFSLIQHVFSKATTMCQGWCEGEHITANKIQTETNSPGS